MVQTIMLTKLLQNYGGNLYSDKLNIRVIE